MQNCALLHHLMHWTLDTQKIWKSSFFNSLTLGSKLSLFYKFFVFFAVMSKWYKKTFSDPQNANQDLKKNSVWLTKSAHIFFFFGLKNDPPYSTGRVFLKTLTDYQPPPPLTIPPHKQLSCGLQSLGPYKI